MDGVGKAKGGGWGVGREELVIGWQSGKGGWRWGVHVRIT